MTGNVTGNASGTALTVTQAAQTAITSVGTLTALTVDNISINTSTVTASGDLIFDAASDIDLDADGGKIKLKDDGTEFGQIFNNSGLHIISKVSDQDIVFLGNDGGSEITALTLDMSAAGKALFNAGLSAGGDITMSTHELLFSDNGQARFGTGEDLKIYHDGSHSYIEDVGTGNLRIRGQQIEMYNPDGSESIADFNVDGAITLYHNGSSKFATASTGIAVTGTLTGATNLVTQVASGSTDAMNTNDTFNIHTATVNSAYLVIANANDSLTNVIAFVAIGTSASTMRITNQGGSYNTTVTGSGANIQITNGYGSSLTYTYRVIQIQ